MKLHLTNRRKWLLSTGAALLLTATPSFALFGIGDIVFDPTSYASLVSQLTTLESQYNMLKNNITHFSAKQQWQTTLHALENVNVATTQNGGVLTQFGLTELSCIALFTLVSMSVNWSTTGMTFRLHHDHVHVGDLTNFLLRLIICCLLENYWVNPFPGASFGINHFFSYIAQAMVAAFDQSSLNNLLQLLKTAGDGTTMPSFTAPLQILCYMVVQIMLGLASAILFLINCSSFILYGVTALFGPVFIPLLMTKTFRAKFFHFLDVLIGFAMIRAVAAAFIFVWAGFMNAFLQQTFNGNYSMEMWMANLIPCLMVFVAFIINMLFIPSMTQAIFGGAAGMADGMTKIVGAAASLATMAGGA